MLKRFTGLGVYIGQAYAYNVDLDQTSCLFATHPAAFRNINRQLNGLFRGTTRFVDFLLVYQARIDIFLNGYKTIYKIATSPENVSIYL